MRKIETTVYLYDELDDKAQARAREWFRDASVSDEWWEGVYEDASQAGLKITGFDLGARQSIDGKFVDSAEECARAIVDNHGTSCETWRTASEYLRQRDNLIDTAPRDEDGEFEDEIALDDAIDAIDREFLRDILEDYRINLQHEYDWMLSDDTVADNIRANEYEFDADGKLA